MNLNGKTGNMKFAWHEGSWPPLPPIAKRADELATCKFELQGLVLNTAIVLVYVLLSITCPGKVPF
jgi:hypothetical protein